MVLAVRDGLLPLSNLPSWVNAITQMDCWWLEEDTSASPEQLLKAYGHFPQINMLEELDRNYPDAKFILNTRDADKWLQSVSTYGPLRQILRDADIPGLPIGKGETDQELIEWFQNHIVRVREYFGDQCEDRFLEFSIDDADAESERRLRHFLGVPISWGHENATTWS